MEIFKRLSFKQMCEVDNFVHRHLWIPSPLRYRVCEAFEFEITDGELGKRSWPFN